AAGLEDDALKLSAIVMLQPQAGDGDIAGAGRDAIVGVPEMEGVRLHERRRLFWPLVQDPDAGAEPHDRAPGISPREPAGGGGRRARLPSAPGLRQARDLIAVGHVAVLATRATTRSTSSWVIIPMSRAIAIARVSRASAATSSDIVATPYG